MSKCLLVLLAVGCLGINVVHMQQTCVDQNTSLCALFGSQYCDGTSYLNGMLYSAYCAKLCNNCNSKRGVFVFFLNPLHSHILNFGFFFVTSVQPMRLESMRLHDRCPKVHPSFDERAMRWLLHV